MAKKKLNASIEERPTLAYDQWWSSLQSRYR
jgi:hypothetical protein